MGQRMQWVSFVLGVVAACATLGLTYLVATGAVSESDESRASTEVDRGWTLYEVGELEEALEAFDEAIRLDSGGSAGHVGKAATLLALYEPEAAVRSASRSTRIAPASADALAWEGLAFLAQGRTEDARTSFEACLESDESRPECEAGLIRVLLAEGEVETAVERGELLLVQAPSNADALYAAGIALYRSNRTVDALSVLLDAAALRPGSAEIRRSIGHCHYVLDELDQAVRSYRQAIELSAAVPQTRLWLARSLTSLGRYEDAEEAAREAVRLGDDVAQNGVVQAEALSELGRFQEAADALLPALDAEPGNASIYRRRGNALKLAGQFDEARASLERAIALDPDDALSLRLLGDTLFTLGHLDVAMSRYDRAIHLDPSNARFFDARGDLWQRLDNDESALADFRRAALLDPTYAYPAIREGELLVEQGDLEGAASAFTRAIDVDKADSRAIAGLAEVLMSQGDSASAIDYLAQAATQTNEAEDYFVLGDALAALERWEDAEEALTTSIELDSDLLVAYRERGYVRLSGGKPGSAVADLERALAASPADIELLWLLADSLMRIEKPEAALARYEEILSIEPGNQPAVEGRLRAIDALARNQP